MFVSRQMRTRVIKRKLGIALSILFVVGGVIYWFLNVQAGIASWAPPKIQMIADGAGSGIECVVADNKVYCWGNVNTYGQLGTNDNTTVSYIPRQINDPNGVLVGKTITNITIARTGTVCVVASNVPYCWGRGQYGALGDNTTSDRYYPSAVTTSGVLAGKTITNIGAGDGHVCVVASGAAYCWGANGSGRLGDGSTTQRNTPVAVSTSGVLSGKTVTSISGASGTTCAVASGAAYCWGDDTSGFLGNDATYANSTTPVAVDTTGVMSGKTMTGIMSGSNHTCALASDSTAFCWGIGAAGQLGNNATPADSPVPVQVYASGAISGKTLTKISAGSGRSCLIDSNSDGYCWGTGPVGDGSGGTKLVPTKVTGASTLNGMKLVQIAPGGSGTCFLNSVNRLFCATLSGGILGNNTSGSSSPPVMVLFTATFNAPNYRLYANADSATPGSPLAGINTSTTLPSFGQAFRVRMGIKTTPEIGSLTSNGGHTCGISDGKAYCWGLNTYGELGNNSTSESHVPVPVDMSGVLSGKTIKAISAGQYHTCAIASDNQAYCWGYGAGGRLGNSSSAESHVPVAVTTSGVLSGKTVLSIAVGGTYTCAIASDNQAYCWGTGTNGQLGNAGTSNRTSPVAVNTSGVLSGKQILSISAGYNQACAVASDNLAYCWGYNNQGQLGDNSTTQRPSPVAVNTAGVLSGKTIRSISTRGLSTDAHTCAIASDGLAYCWGRNFYGELGNNSTSDSSVPVAVNTAGVLSGKTIRIIKSGGVSTCAVASDGLAYCWGYNTQGQLGDNSTSESHVPVAAYTSGVLSGKTITNLQVSTSHTCVTTSEGKTYCWGVNTYGRFGNSLTDNSSVAVTAPLLEGYVTGAGINPSDNTYKLQFAQKTLSSCSVQTGFADVTGSTAIAFSTNGSVSNGASITSNSNDPVPTTDSTPQTYISASGTFTNTSTIPGGKTGLWDFSLKDNSSLYDTSYCLRLTYGDGSPIEGSVQYPEIKSVAKRYVKQSSYRVYQNADSAVPGSPLANTDTVGSIGSFSQSFRIRTGIKATPIIDSMVTGSSRPCVISGGNVYCWGGGDSTVPVAINTSGVLSGKTILAISSNYNRTCVVASDNQAYCWGSYPGDGTTNSPTPLTPVAVDTSGVLSGKTILSISAGQNHTCVVASDNQAYCWGYNGLGQLGNNSTTTSLVPIAINTSGVLSGKTVVALTAASTHTCAIASDNNTYCWGDNTYGQLGNNSTAPSLVPTAVNTAGVLSGKTILSIVTGRDYTCSIASDNNAYCWGYNWFGQLGDNSTTDSLVPVAVDTSGVLSGKTVLSISGGEAHTCAIASDNNAYCWGSDGHGELGSASPYTPSLVPVAVDTSGVLSGKTIRSISASTNGNIAFTCVIASDNQTYCWGDNAYGQLGNNTTTPSPTVTQVVTDGYINTGDLNPSTNSYKLQFAEKTLSSCSVQTGFADVTGSTAIAFNTNGSVSNGAAITTNANDPVPTADSIAQTYISASGTFTNTSTIPGGKTGLWDFSLKENGGVDSTAYCLRIVYSDNTVIDASTQYAEVMTSIKQPTVAAPYRFYKNANSLTPGSPLGITGQPATLSSPNQAFRLRTGVMGTLSASEVSTGISHTCIIASSDTQAYCWGLGVNGQIGNNSTTYSLTPTAVDTSGVLSGKTISAISSGSYYSCVIASDNNAYCWGDNTNGQLGNNSTSQSNVPVAVTTSGVLSGKTILAISTGTSHTCAIASDNNAYCWGLNTNGQLGNNSTSQSLVPVAVNTAGVLSGKTVTSIQVGTSHTCVIASDNLAYCWGLNTNGQLGNNSTSESHVPVAVNTAGVLSGKTILSLSAGNFHNCVVASDNLAYCWGAGGNGRLGHNSGSQSLVAVAVNTAGVLSGKTILSVAAAGSQSCAIASDNHLYCWGFNANGYLGNDSTTQSFVPVAVDTSGALNGKSLSSISSKFFSACAISSDSQVYCWGNNGSGQLGAGDVATYLVPQRVVSYLPGHKVGVDGKTALGVAAGFFHTCAIASDNLAYCWGYNSSGQLGNSTPLTSNISPVTVAVNTTGVLSGKTIRSIGGGYYHTCAIASDNKPYCWGMSSSGQLGNNTFVQSEVPVAVDMTGVLAGKTILSLSVGAAHSCVIASDNKAYCWGANSNGQLGNNSVGDSSVPVAVDMSGVLSGKTILSITAGWLHTCAIASDNQAYCWGMNDNWELGNNSIVESHVPVAVSTSGAFAGKTVRSITAGQYHTCAIASDNQAYCWGTGSFGRLGNNSTGDAHVPTAVNTAGVLSGKTIISLSAGHWHTCAIASDNQAYCWGRNNNGQLGNNSTSDSLVPVAVTNSGVLSGKTILSTTAGDASTCAIASDNQIYCWGQNSFSQLGDGSFSQSLVPIGGPTIQYTPVSGTVSASTNSYTLQYAVKSATTCGMQTTGFADVTTSTPIAFNTNASVTSGTAISTTANDPLAAGQTTVQTYISATGTFTNANMIATGAMGMWDFSLKDNGAPYNTSYCLRVAYSDGTALTDSQALPEVRTTSGTLSVGFVDSMGQGLSNPTTTLGNVTVLTSSWQPAYGTLGAATQKLRVYNDLATNGWSASIAATNGPTALWDRTDHVVKYDFNDAAPVDGGDADTLSGGLGMDPTSGTITSPSGCGTTGLSLGSQASFNEGSVNSITLFSATNTAAMGCAYDLQNVGVVQLIPAAQASGTYTIDMTVTVVAL